MCTHNIRLSQLCKKHYIREVPGRAGPESPTKLDMKSDKTPSNVKRFGQEVACM